MISTLALHVVAWFLLALGPTGGQTQAAQPVQTRSPHGNLAIPCQNCHSYTAWKPIRNVPEFDHSKTRYPLRGMHASVSCTQCHTRPVFTNVGSKCADCHADIHRRQNGAQCEQCHTVKGWHVSMVQVKEHQNRFPLLGAHAALDCDACHTQAAVGRFVGLSTQCVSCHLTTFQKTTSPPHMSTGFPTQCEQCHVSMDTWLGAKFDHAKVTGFALTGMHASLDCTACHVGGRYTGTPSNCVGCHAKDYTGAKNPDHVKLGFPQSCSTCHGTATWLNARFDHNATGFPLTGAHSSVSCIQCHVGNNFTSTPKDCASCHLADFKKTTNPNHVALGFPMSCQTCHSTVSWAQAKFDHNTFTSFPLTGAHVGVPCAQCHVGGKFAGTPKDCASCHLPDFNKTTSPNHKAAGFPTTCQTCHTTATWAGAVFDHSKTMFPLTGAHTSVACAQCHVGGRYAGLPTTCVSCHLKDFNATTSPNHVTSGFPQTCEVCHSTSAWSPAHFDHSKTAFPLTGAHVSVPCALCHVGGKYAGIPTQCSSCHLTDYNKTTDPNHKAAGFPTDCSICHTTASWAGAKFDHSKTLFPLTGAHTSLTCNACHASGKYAGLSTTCVSCHLKDFNATTSPNHVTAGFPQTCEVCHTTSAWSPSTFDHSKTAFPLTGAHKTVACASCHIGGRYAGTPTDCYSCHKKDYAATTSPNHVAAAFPTTCQTCHTTTSWAGATFNHTWFPIYSGTHAGKWTTCADCHTNSSNYAIFSCITCHTHNKTDTDSNHRDVGGYVYSPTSCYSCHPTGRAGG